MQLLRRHSVALLAALLAAAVAIPGDVPFAVLALVPLYFVAHERPWWWAAAGAAAVAGATGLHLALWGGGGGWSEIGGTSAISAIVAVVGWAVGERSRAGARERELLAETAAAEERLRIARELHDAVGHDVSLMVVQAQALGATAEDQRVRDGAEAIAELGRRTMGEMHRTLRLLRDEDATRAPQPGLDALDDVLAGARAAGVEVSVAMEGAPRPLGPALDASAFRIVQEAVTNVVRHAGGAPASVTVRYGAEALELVIADQGSGGGSNGGGGHGLVGMRERAALFGGTLDAGPRAGGGFEVRAMLPYPDHAT
jgi:signal transduction histidine kinase